MVSQSATGLPSCNAGLNFHFFTARSRSRSAAGQPLLRVTRTSPMVPLLSSCASTIGIPGGTVFGHRSRTRFGSGSPLMIQTGCVTRGVRVGRGSAISAPSVTAASETATRGIMKGSRLAAVSSAASATARSAARESAAARCWATSSSEVNQDGHGQVNGDGLALQQCWGIFPAGYCGPARLFVLGARWFDRWRFQGSDVLNGSIGGDRGLEYEDAAFEPCITALLCKVRLSLAE